MQTHSFIAMPLSSCLQSPTDATGKGFYSIPILKARARELALNLSYLFLLSICQLKRYIPTPWENLSIQLAEFESPQ